MEVRTAVIGYGLSGSVFHTPFIHSHPGFRLHTIVTSGDEAKKRYPDVRIARDFESVINDPEIELVCICTPNEFHFEQASQALLAGKHVIIEKPITPRSGEAAELTTIARTMKRYLFPFQNRRWDGDFLTVKQILEQGLLGKVLDFESHFDRYNPTISRAAWRYVSTVAGGTLYDLGTHLIDQALVLFGQPEAVFCRLFNQRELSLVDDSFVLNLIYPDLQVTLKAGVFVREPGPRFTLHGTRGSFIKYGLDPQEEALRQGKWPKGKIWGMDRKSNWGTLHTISGGHIIRGPVETFPGDYMGFFGNVYQVLRAGAEQAVNPEEAVETLRIIEMAMESAQKQRVMSFSP